VANFSMSLGIILGGWVEWLESCLSMSNSYTGHVELIYGVMSLYVEGP